MRSDQKFKKVIDSWMKLSEEQIQEKIKESETRILMAKMWLYQNRPFWGDLIVRMRPQASLLVPTTAVNKDLRLLYNPAWIASLSDADLLFEMQHECMHLVQGFFERGEDFGAFQNPAKKQVFNLAADYVVDTHLIAAGVQQSQVSKENVGPDEQALVRKLGTTEKIAEFLWENHVKNCSKCNSSSNKDGEDSFGTGEKGSSEKDSSSENQMSSGIQSSEEQNDSDSSKESQGNGDLKQKSSVSPSQNEGGKGSLKQLLESLASEEFCPHNTRKCGFEPKVLNDPKTKFEAMEMVLSAAEKEPDKGNLPASVKEYLIKIEKPKISWKSLIRKSATQRFKPEYTWNRPSRRSFNLRMPAKKKEISKSAVVVYDTSGSISRKEHVKFLSEVYSLLKGCGCQKVYMVFHDVNVHTVEEFDLKRVQEGKLPISNGGTSHMDVFKLLTGDHEEFTIPEKIETVICFTDLITVMPEKNPLPKSDIFWVVYEGNNVSYKAPSYGKVVVIPKD